MKTTTDVRHAYTAESLRQDAEGNTYTLMVIPFCLRWYCANKPVSPVFPYLTGAVQWASEQPGWTHYARFVFRVEGTTLRPYRPVLTYQEAQSAAHEYWRDEHGHQTVWIYFEQSDGVQTLYGAVKTSRDGSPVYRDYLPNGRRTNH